MTRRTRRSGRSRIVLQAAVCVAAAGALLTAAACRPKPGGTLERQAQQVQRSSPDKRPWFCNAVGDGTPPSGHGNGAHVHPNYQGKTKGPLSWADCITLAQQLDKTIAATKGFETRAKGEAAGWRPVAPYVTGLGTHHVRGAGGGGGMTMGTMPGGGDFARIGQCLQEKGVDLSGGFPNLQDPKVIDALTACGVPMPTGGGGMGAGGGFMGGFDPAKPPMLIYGGDGPEAPLVGVAYAFAGGDNPPEAYAGGNDWWHLHTHACFGLDLKKFPDPEDLTKEQCEAAGGRYQQLFPGSGAAGGGVWLLHLWPFQPYEYAPDLFVSGHPCLHDDGAAPQSDACWKEAHRDPALGAPPKPTTPTPTSSPPDPGEHGDHGDHPH